MGRRVIARLLVLGFLAAGCATTRARGPEVTPPLPREELRFEPVTVTADLELEKLNAEELFAQGSAAYAAEDYQKAARYFGRLADFHATSPHRRPSLYNAGLALEKLKQWEEAYIRFSELSDPEGFGDGLDAAFRVAETQYHLGRFADAAQLLSVIAAREALPMNKRFEAQVQQGICELEGGASEKAEGTLRKAVTTYQGLADPDEVDDYYPAQAQFFLGEIYRLHYESIELDPDKGTDQLAKDLEYKAELLLSAQGHYLRAIRIGNGYWATASGAQVGGLYENLHAHMVNSRAPKELDQEEAAVYQKEVRKKIRILITKAINIYERTLEAAERIGASNPFVERTRESLRKMKELLVAEAQEDEELAPPPASKKAPTGQGGVEARAGEPHS